VIAEVLTGKTLLLGSSTPNQLQKILQLTAAASPTNTSTNPAAPPAAEPPALPPGGAAPAPPAPHPSDATLRAMRVDLGASRALIASLGPLEPTRLGKRMIGAPADGMDLCRQLLRLDPTERIDAEAALRHPYFHPFSSGDDGRAVYAAASLAPPKHPYVPPTDDRVRSDVASYRSLVERRLATPLADPPPPPAAAAGSTDSSAAFDEMGA